MTLQCIRTDSVSQNHRIKISNRRATQRCNVSAFFYAKICSLLARRRSSQPVQRVYWPENVIDWLGKWRPTCVMRHARGQKLQSFRRKWPFYMNLYSMTEHNNTSHRRGRSCKITLLLFLYSYKDSCTRLSVVDLRNIFIHQCFGSRRTVRKFYKINILYVIYYIIHRSLLVGRALD